MRSISPPLIAAILAAVYEYVGVIYSARSSVAIPYKWMRVVGFHCLVVVVDCFLSLSYWIFFPIFVSPTASFPLVAYMHDNRLR